jgi:hypothetical protein
LQVEERRIGRADDLNPHTACKREGRPEVQRGQLEGRLRQREPDSYRRRKPWNSVYYRYYAAHFATHSGDLEELIDLGGKLRNPHAEATVPEPSCDLDIVGIE